MRAASHAARPPLPAAAPVVLPAVHRRTALLLVVALLIVYVANFRMLAAGDSLPTRVLPFSLVREGNLDLDEFSWERNAQGRLPYYVHQPGPHIYSVSTVATALVIAPLYVLPAWYLSAAGISYDDVRARVIIVAMERFSAALLAALSAAVLYLALTRLTSRRWALGLAVVYGLGTTTWAISSQALWAHALSQLSLATLCLVLLAPRPSRSALIFAGFAAGVAVANRPQMAVFAALAFLFVVVHHRRHLLAFVAAPALIAVLLVLYNRAIFHALAGGYGGFDHFSGPLLEGVFGLFVSPNRGLLVYTPIMLFALWGAVQVWRVEAPPWLRWLTIGIVLHVLIHAKFKEWWAGYTYGPRYLTDVLPGLVLLLVYGLVPLCRARALQIVAAVLAMYGIFVQAVGVYAADDSWNRTPQPLERRPERVWDWSDLQIVRAVRGGPRAGELAWVMIDAFRDPQSAQVRELLEKDLQSTIYIGRHAAVVEPGTPMQFRVQITNRGSAAWPAFSGEGVISARYLMFLLARWFVDGEPVAGAGDVVALPENVAPGETVGMRLALTAPPRPGRFELELRVSQAVDGVHGIAGPDSLRVPITVQRSSGGARTAAAPVSR